MHYVSIILLLLSFNSIANEEVDLYKALNDRINYCNALSDRNIVITKDAYFDSLNTRQKTTAILMLYSIAVDRCNAYEESRYLKAVIRNKSKVTLNALSGLYNTGKDTEEEKKIIKSLDIKEIERLSHSEMFYLPFNPMDLTDKLEIY